MQERDGVWGSAGKRRKKRKRKEIIVEEKKDKSGSVKEGRKENIGEKGKTIREE